MKRRRSLYAWVGFCSLINGAFIASADPLDVWQWRNPLPQGNVLRGSTYANGTIVAVGGNGTILSSTDGASWTIHKSESFAELDSIAYGNSVFVAVGQDGTILSSNDGAVWTSRQSTNTNDLYCVTFGNGVFLAGGNRGTLLRSTNGVVWTKQDT